jgi:hypothetical protein
VTDSPTTSGGDVGAGESGASGQAAHAPGGQNPAGINVQQLADKVYDLLLADARLGRARGDSPLIAQRNGEG